MNYCILVELSRKSIAFSYYTDDIDKFEPYGDEPVKPLAVWFSGSSVIVGTDAKNEAQKGTSNAFYDLFELMERQEHFSYANEKHEYKKLILYTIRAGLREFFIRVMLNTLGTLDENIAKLPLLLVIGSDVELNERNVLMKQLRDNGFGNVSEISEDRYIIHSFYKEKAFDLQLSLILSSDGEHIYGTVYKGIKSVENFICKNAGKDPRVDKLANLAWERTQAENDWLKLENEMPELRNAAIKFIQSGDIECNDNITLSNGYEYSFYLTREDLNLYNQNDGGHIVQEIVNRVIQHGDKQTCLAVLKDKAASNRYLQDLLQSEFRVLKILDKTNKAIVMERIVKWCKEKTFLFARSYPPTVPVYVDSEPVTGAPTKRDERNFKMLALSVETYLRNGDTRSARHEAEEFLKEMHERHINEFDARVEQLLPKNKPTGVPATESTSKPTAVPPSPRDNRSFKILLKSVETSTKNGITEKTISEINAFIQEMHGKSVYAFDEEAEKMKKQLRETSRCDKSYGNSVSDFRSEGRHATVKSVPENKPTQNKPTPVSKPSIVDKANALMKQEKYKEARELYREANLQQQANDCTTLIKWSRLLAQYKSEVSATIQNRNIDKAQRRTREIQEYIALYKQYDINEAELEVLKKEYKRIK